MVPRLFCPRLGADNDGGKDLVAIMRQCRQAGLWCKILPSVIRRERQPIPTDSGWLLCNDSSTAGLSARRLSSELTTKTKDT